MTEKNNKIIEEIKHPETTGYVSVSDKLKLNFDISPQDFVSYAEKDLELDYNHNIINALANSKRALDCQLDSLMIAFGYYKISQKQQWSFPKKLDLITELGLIAPRVLKKINKQRNLLEHQFIRPEKEKVEDFIDITMLFIASTDNHIFNFKFETNLKNEKFNKYYRIKNDYENSTIKISTNRYDGKLLGNLDSLEILEKFELQPNEKEYTKVLKIFLDLTK